MSSPQCRHRSCQAARANELMEIADHATVADTRERAVLEAIKIHRQNLPVACRVAAELPSPAPDAGPSGSSILRDPRASDPETGPDRALEGQTDAPGSSRSSIDELGRVGVTPLTAAGRAALRSDAEPLSGIPGLYMRGPADAIVRYELTDTGRAARSEFENERLEELRERLARERAPWLFRESRP
ncbi:MAG: hypothetical protein AB7T31_15000 [Gemmatimonadales bacterium]